MPRRTRCFALGNVVVVQRQRTLGGARIALGNTRFDPRVDFILNPTDRTRADSDRCRERSGGDALVDGGAGCARCALRRTAGVGCDGSSCVLRSLLVLTRTLRNEARALGDCVGRAYSAIGATIEFMYIHMYARVNRMQESQ